MRPRKPTLPLSDRMVEEVAARFKALGEPLRLRILQALESGEATVSDLVDRLGANQSNVSRHLQTLHDAALVGRRREGSNTFYFISDPTVIEICNLICNRAEEDARRRLKELHPGHSL